MNYGSFNKHDSRNNAAQTPEWLYKELDETHAFDFDPCPGGDNTVDGLAETTEWGKSNYVNPPYGRIKWWLRKGLAERNKGKKSVFLVPFRPHCKYWQTLVVDEAQCVHIICNKIAFSGYSLPFPGTLCLIEYGTKKKRVAAKTKKTLKMLSLKTAN